MAQGLINNGVSVTKSFSPNEYQLLADYTVSGSAITSYTFSGLNINADEEVVLVSDFINTTTGATPALYVNGNITSSNYYIQRLQANGTTISGARANTQFYCEVSSNQKSYSFLNIKLTNNGYFVYQSNVEQSYGTSSILIDNLYVTSTFTLSQINSLNIVSGASSIGIGSRFQLYKVKGQVQQTWATT